MRNSTWTHEEFVASPRCIAKDWITLWAPIKSARGLNATNNVPLVLTVHASHNALTSLAGKPQEGLRRTRRGGIECLFRDLCGAAARLSSGHHSPEDVCFSPRASTGETFGATAQRMLAVFLVVLVLGLVFGGHVRQVVKRVC